MSQLNALFVFLALLPSAGIAKGADLRVTVEGLRNQDAPLYFSLYVDPQAFEQMDEGTRLAVVKSWSEHPSVAFTDLAPGRYVVAVFQDINGNGELDTNFIGRPTEPYALSGNAADSNGPPKFDEAVLHIQADNKAIRLQLRD